MSTMYLTLGILLDVRSVRMFIQGKYSFLTCYYLLLLYIIIASYQFLIKLPLNSLSSEDSALRTS